MQSDVVISVRDLGKRYVIDDESQGRSLKEAVTDGVKGIAGKFFGGSGAQRRAEEFWALRHVNFEVKHGEVIGIVGPNGSGKSTLLKILSRITDPTEGEVRLKGRVASLLEVGTGFRGELSGRDNVFLNGAILGLSKAEITRRFDEIVDFAGVEKFIDTPVKHYSSGMYMRLAFSVATSLVTDILMLDEVLAVGDAEFQKKCMARVAEIRRSGRTILFVSHDSTAVARMCSRAIYLEHGRVQLVGSAAQVVKEYERRVVASYIAKAEAQPAPAPEPAPAPTAVAQAPAAVAPPREAALRAMREASTELAAVSAPPRDPVRPAPAADPTRSEVPAADLLKPAQPVDASPKSAAVAATTTESAAPASADTSKPAEHAAHPRATSEHPAPANASVPAESTETIASTEPPAASNEPDVEVEPEPEAPVDLTSIAIGARHDRQGNRAFRFIDALVKPVAETPGGVIRCGDEILLRVWIDNPDARPIADVDVAVGVDNARGERVTLLSTQLVSATLREAAPGWTTIDFHLPRLALAPDRYTYTLFGTAQGEIADWVIGAGAFEVEQGDFFRNGIAPPVGQGSALMPFSIKASGVMPVPLAQRSDRDGSGAFFFDTLVVQPALGAPMRTVHAGADVVFQVTVSNPQPRPLADVNIALGFDDPLGDRVATMTTEAIGATLEALPPGVSTVEFRARKLPLTPGRYTLSVAGTAGGELADRVRAAESIDVVDGDFFGKGRRASQEQGRLLFPYSATSNANPLRPLVERRDRKGSGRFKFVDAQVQPYQGVASGVGAVRSGSDVVLQIWIDNASGAPLADVDVAVGLDNEAGERIAIFTTFAAAATVTQLPPGLSSLDFRIERLPFVPGRYTFTLFGTSEGAIADWVQGAGFFDVTDGDFFATGRSVPAGQGSVLIPYSVTGDLAGSSAALEIERSPA